MCIFNSKSFFRQYLFCTCCTLVLGLTQANAQPGQHRLPNIVLNPGDTAVFAPAPQGFDTRRENIARGRIDTVIYASKTVGTRRKMLVYTPPGYPAHTTYPVLYLLHGIGGDEEEWHTHASPELVLDNLYAEGKIVPMIVVLPNGRAQPNDRAEGDIYQHAPAFAAFEQDLLTGVIPFVEAHYAVEKDRMHRALAGLSMGGGQSLNFGLGNLDTFAWVGAFSAAPNTRKPEQLVPYPQQAARQLKLLWVSCGDKDGLLFISQGVHAYLQQHQVPHIWQVEAGGHDWPVWKNDLWLFSQRLFR